MHGRESEDWKRRRRHMWRVPAPAPPVVVSSSSSTPADLWIKSSVDSFLKDGRKICIGDCALFQAGNAPPFIGIIRWFTTDKEDCLKLCVNWLYRPADIKLVKGILLEAAPNEVFYSFHQDVISAASLLHPCKVAFLRRGVELPPGLSSFVCRRVYDIANKCLWWLTDQDYINERQEEVDHLLDKTRVEMHAAVQSGDRSPKPLNGPTSTQQLKSDTESLQNSSSSFPSQVKGKKRERGGDQGTEPIKRERPTKLEDGESASSRLDNMAKAEIAKIAEKGSLITTEGVDKLVHLMQLDKNERKIDLSGRILFADVIASTDRIECLGRFVQLRGVPVLDDWLQEAHKGKTGDGSSPKESDKGTEELLLALLRALDKLPVNLNALQTCNIGKSVNHLRTHKNLEIQKKARSLVDTWKKRVDAEMKRVDAEMTKINDAKSGGSNQAMTWPGKQGFSEVSHGGGKRSGSVETITKPPGTQTSTCRTVVGKPGHADAIVKSTPVAQGSLKLSSSASLPASVSISLKDSPGKGAGGSGNSDLPLATVKEEKSSSSSQSQNNSQSCSSDHAKRMSSSWKEDARSSTAGSMSANKTSGGSSRNRRSSNGLLASGVSGVQKETNLVKAVSVNRSAPMDKVSSQSGLSSEAGADHGNSHRLIVRLPNPGRSPARGANGGSLEDPSIPSSRTSSPGASDKHDQTDRKIKLKGDAYRSHISADVNAESWQSNDVKEALVGSDEGERSPATVLDEERGQDAPRPACSSSGNGKGVFLTEPKSRDSFSSMNALIESCAKYSEPSALSAGDDIGINLLANVAAGEISKSDLVSPSASPRRSPKEEHSEVKSRFSCEDGGGQNDGHSDENADFDSTKQGKDVAPLLSSEKLQETSLRPSDMKGAVESKGANQSAVDDKKQVDCTHEKIADSTAKHSNLAGSSLGENPMTGEKPEKLVAEESSPDSPIVNEVPSDATLANQPQLPIEESHSLTSDRNGNDAKPSSTDKFSCLETADVCTSRKSDGFKDDNLKPANSARKEQTALASRSNEQAGSAAVSPNTISGIGVILERKEAPTEESDKCAKSVASKLSGADPDKKEKTTSADVSSVLVTSDADNGAKLDFDLNEGFSGDDGNQSEHVISAAPVSSPSVHLPAISPFAPATITVAAPAKRPFVPPENLLKSKGEPGWRGSAATSAFRPAEPRKVLEMPLNTSDVKSADSAGKQSRPAFEIDLNVADERVLEDLASPSSPQTTGSESGVISNRDAPTRSAGGLDLDLNKVDESTDNGQFLASSSSRLETPIMSMKPISRGFPNGEANMFRDFDLNNGPGVDEVGTDTLPKNQHAKNSNNMPFLPQFSGLRMGNTEIGNVSSWFPPGNSYPAVAIPSFLPDRGEQTFPIVTAPGSQRILGSVSGGGTFGGDVYRGPVLSSSPAMTFSHATSFPYPAGFPFGSSFPLTSTSFDSPSAASCYPAIPSQLVGQAAAVSSHYARPYMINLPEGSASAGQESIRKWSRQGLDLNAGPGGGGDVDVKDERLPSSSSRQLPVFSSQAFVEEQARMYHQVSGGGIKRKDREGGSWDERLYKQSSWQ
ncbi:uncharacterized protein LOC109849685 isoform X2 [Asparagus officinalis]|uniref:uncharacterized protein LOC109849685 isoform X2 n=1 Tax=Asparagus officinalis TaxID=4686 RepID=UPI00098E26B1|nr:uncharacterized protein LOC109849685 isoform X2 [Asparagus officinalis]